MVIVPWSDSLFAINSVDEPIIAERLDLSWIVVL